MAHTQQTHRLNAQGFSIFTSYLQATQPRSDKLTAVILHGAGKSQSARFDAIAAHFATAGVSVVALDFVGHGNTGDDMQRGSLALRVKHAKAAISHWLDAKTPLILLGSSMGAHTALRLLSALGNRVKSICLLQPAIYAKEAETIPFTEEFTKILRRDGSWRTSLALKNAASFSGTVYIGIGSEDTVIPWGVVEHLAAAFKDKASALRLEVHHGAAHNLPEWLPAHKTHCRQMVDYLIN
jgi:alpha-beta hydrolase superfamily lysophospholipase